MPEKNKITIYKIGNSFFSNKTEAFDLASQSSFGELKNGKVIYTIYEVLYLLETNKAELIDNKNKKISFRELYSKNSKEHIFYLVFKDLREKGMIVKEGLKFGTDFRIYSKGEKPGKNHAKYLLYVKESNKKLDLKDFCAKARVANTTHKVLLLAIIDREEDINYYAVNWIQL